jgi:hypothetical protein
MPKGTLYRSMLQGFYFHKTKSTQNAPFINVSVFVLDNKMKEAKKFE